MSFFRFVLLFTLWFSIQNCTEKADPSPLDAALLPANAKAVPGHVHNLNTWTEKGKFMVTGVCTNSSADWQKIWLNMTPLTASGKPLSIAKHASAILSTFSDAIPPYGQTSFFASWPLTDISGKPDSVNITIAGAVAQTPGPILVVPMVSALKMFGSSQPGQPAADEIAWQVSGSLQSPLEMLVAAHPRFEVLVYGTDNLLWFSTVLNPEDPAVKPIFHFVEREGPLMPKEERGFTLQVFYESLPQTLKEQKIGHIDLLPFEAR